MDLSEETTDFNDNSANRCATELLIHLETRFGNKVAHDFLHRHGNESLSPETDIVNKTGAAALHNLEDLIEHSGPPDFYVKYPIAKQEWEMAGDQLLELLSLSPNEFLVRVRNASRFGGMPF